MLCDEQVQIVSGCHERYRSWHPSEDGIGITGTLSSQFDSELGTISSVTHSRILTHAEQTLLAQLTLTALVSSPVNWTNIRMTFIPTDSAPHPAESLAGRPRGFNGDAFTGVGTTVTAPGGDQ